MQPPFPSLTAEWHNTTYPAVDPTQEHLSVKGKTVMITGGGRGIGNRVAHAFAAAGASIIGITGRTQSSLEDVKSSIQKSHSTPKVLTFVADVLDERAMDAAFAGLKAASPGQGGVDILIHNAGYLAGPSAIGAPDADTNDYWKSYETNIRGSYITTRAFLANLRPKNANHEPVLIALSTAGIAFFPPPPTFSSYATSMVAKARFFESVAVENPEVRVINCHPGAIETEMGKKASDAGLILPPDDIDLAAHFIVWLVSAEAEFLRSRMVWAQWDIEELKGKKEKILADPAYLNMGMNGWPYAL